MNNKQYSIKELGEIVAVDSMKASIKKLGQYRVLEIINGGKLVLNDIQRKAYKQVFFKALIELEG